MSSLMEQINDLKVMFERGQLIGIDISLSSVKIALVSEVKKGQYRLDKFTSMPLSEAAIIEDDIQKPAEVIEAISSLISQEKITKRIACIGLHGPNTVTKRMRVPDGPKTEVEENILWESEQYIPFDSEDAEIGFSILSKNSDDDIVDVVMGAVRTDIAEKYVDYVKESGLVAKVVDLNVLAVINVFEVIKSSSLEEISSEGAIIVDFGAQYTTIIIYKNGGPILTKEIPIGGVLLTEEIQRTMGVSYDEAEDLKVHGDDNGNLPEEILGILENYIEKLTNELKKVLNFYIAAGSNDQVGYCFVTGGSSRLPGIQEALQDFVDLEIEELNPFEALSVKGNFSDDELTEIAYVGLAAIGLGMRSV